MKALQLKSAGDLEIIETAVPEPGDAELLIKTGAATICTSDLNDIRDNPFKIPLPVIIGHEGAGTVVKAGKAVKGFKIGDRIAAHPVHPCLACGPCREGMGHLCEAMGHFGLNRQGTFAEYFTVREDRARVIPQGVDYPLATLAEPVCVCLEALSQAKLKPGQTLLIIGDGPFGILLTRLAASKNLSKVVICGRHDFRLGFARRAVTINDKTLNDVPAGLRKASDGLDYDAVILAVGTQQAFQTGLELLKPKGRIVIFSAIPGETPVDLFKVHCRELEIIGACNDQGRLDEAIAVLGEQDGNLGEIITQHFTLPEYKKAFELAEKGREEAIKVSIIF